MLWCTGETEACCSVQAIDRSVLWCTGNRQKRAVVYRQETEACCGVQVRDRSVLWCTGK